MKNFLLIICFVFFIFCQKKEGKLTLETGISYELAKYRKEQISNVVYDLHFKTKVIANHRRFNKS